MFVVPSSSLRPAIAFVNFVILFAVASDLSRFTCSTEYKQASKDVIMHHNSKLDSLVIETHKRFKRTLIYYDIDTVSVS